MAGSEAQDPIPARKDSSPSFSHGWAVPAPSGAPAAVQSLSGVAAPLLAGFSVTMAMLVLQGSERLRYPEATLMLSALAVILMLTCLQCGFSGLGTTGSLHQMRQVRGGRTTHPIATAVKAFTTSKA